MITGKSSGFVTNGSFLSFYAGVRNELRERKMLAHLERIADRVKYLVPSLDPEDRGFDSIRYWRGPVWAVMNYMIAYRARGRGAQELGGAHSQRLARADRKRRLLRVLLSGDRSRHGRRGLLVDRCHVAALGSSRTRDFSRNDRLPVAASRRRTEVS